MSVNKVTLIGRLGQDPEIKNTPNGVPVASFSIATSEKWKGKDGNMQEKTEWHRIVAWQKLAELAGQYLKKGSQVYIEGKLQTRSWDDKDGNKRYATEVQALSIQFLDPSKGATGSKTPHPAEQEAPMPSAPEEEIPF